MSSHNLSLVDHSSLNRPSELFSDKETQTSADYTTESVTLSTDPSRPLPKAIDRSGVKGAITLIECRIMKDPSASKITTSNTESFTKGAENLTVSTSEEIEFSGPCKKNDIPQSNSPLSACEDGSVALENLIHYCSSSELPYEVQIERPAILMSSPRSPLPYVTHALKKANNPDDTQLPPNIEDEADRSRKIDKSLSKDSINKVVKKSLTVLKRSASSCLNKIEALIGTKKSENADGKSKSPTSSKDKFRQSDEDNKIIQDEKSGSSSSIQSAINSEKLSTLKKTVKSVAGKVYKTSKNAVTLIKSESAKLLNKGKSEENNKVVEKASETTPKGRELKIRNLSASSISNYFFQKTENKIIKEEPSKDLNTESDLPSPTINVGKKFSQIKDDIINSAFNKSSPYDRPFSEEELKKHEPSENSMPTVSAIDRIPDPTSTSNMFTIIKSKIFSIFRDDSEKVETTPHETKREDNEEVDPFGK